MLSSYDLSAGLFIRGLSNLKIQLTKAEDYIATNGSGEAALLNAQLTVRGDEPVASYSPADLHRFTLAAQVHWAAEGAKLAIARLLDTHTVPDANHATTFADLHLRLDATIAHLRGITPSALEPGLDRTIVIEHPRGSTSSTGAQFLVAFAIPHFFYHVTTAYGILREQGVPLTMRDFLGNWGSS